ncbi:MAG: 50S ribosomal protein L7/L12 [Candidatus Babeliales bacterium]
MAAKGYERLVDDIANLSVLELSELVKALENKFGVSAAMPMAAAAAPVAAAAPEAAAKTEFKVTLTEAGPEKIKTIKALKAVSSLGLAEAKSAVESVPFVIGETIKKDDAAKMKRELEAVGAKVELL